VKKDYEGWALDTPSLGVTRVWVRADLLGPNSVTVFFVLDNQVPIFPNPTNIQQVQDILNERAPVTVDARALSPTEIKISVEMDLSPNTATVQQNVKDSLDEFFKKNVNTGEIIFKSQLDEAISLAVGEVDHKITDIKVGAVSIGVNDVHPGANELGSIAPADITFN